MRQNKFLLILILFILLFSFLSSFTLAADPVRNIVSNGAERELEVEYPEVPGAPTPGPKTTIPEYVKYIFKFSLIIAAIAAFAILIYGGFRYLTSAGSPETIREAKNWIFGGILGLVILLCSYLILTTINPELLSPREPELKLISGIYLVNKDGERLYYSNSTPTIRKGFEAKYIEFISNKPLDPDLNFTDPKKEELVSVFYYSKEYGGGTVREVKNNKELDEDPPSKRQSLDFPPKSLYFFWLKPGIYLYEKENFATPPPPHYFPSSEGNLEDFDNKASSLKIVNPHSSPFPSVQVFDYYAYLFEEPSFGTESGGTCAFYTDSVGNFSEPRPGEVEGKVSSIAVFRSAELRGEITFYEEINCLTGAKKWHVPISGPAGFITLSGSGLEIWNSIMIHANVTLVLNTNENATGSCALFTGPIDCLETFKGSKIYNPDPDNPIMPRRAAWFPMKE